MDGGSYERCSDDYCFDLWRLPDNRASRSAASERVPEVAELLCLTAVNGSGSAQGDRDASPEER